MDESQEYLKDRLKLLMRNYHLGQDKAIRKRELLAELYGPTKAKDESTNNPYDREMRSMIEQINAEDNGLICSDSTHGYWWAASLSDGLPAAEKNVARALTQYGNAKHLEENLHKAFGGQLDFLGGTK